MRSVLTMAVLKFPPSVARSILALELQSVQYMYLNDQSIEKGDLLVNHESSKQIHSGLRDA